MSNMADQKATIQSSYMWNNALMRYEFRDYRKLIQSNGWKNKIAEMLYEVSRVGLHNVVGMSSLKSKR